MRDKFVELKVINALQIERVKLASGGICTIDWGTSTALLALIASSCPLFIVGE